MDILYSVIQVVVALTIFNVWLIRYNKSTPWRAGSSMNMREEFHTYGLPLWVMNTVKILKLTCATLLIAGIWMDALVKPAAIGLAALMLGAVVMHLKVSDPVKKSLPAASILLLSVGLLAV